MTAYIQGVILMNFLVDFLLLLAAGRFCGYLPKIGRAVGGALMGSLYAGACLLSGFYFLGNFFWRVVSLCVMSMIAYGFSRSALQRGLVFTILCMALDGAVTEIGKGGFWGILSTVGVLFLLCCFGFRGRFGETAYVPVELAYGKKHLCLTALRDTGNTLTDPLTGHQVLVIGADAAQQLTGLTREQLLTPVETIGILPGLRLIPYHSVGSSGFLLALRLRDVKIGSWRGSTLVAFAPERLSMEGAYQALTGGAI